MKKLLLVLMISGVALFAGTSSVYAGGTSDTSGDGYHCYMFFSDNPDTTQHDDGDEYAQWMTNHEYNKEAKKEVRKGLNKYLGDEGMYLIDHTGNIRWRPGSALEGLCGAEPVDECPDPHVLDDEDCICPFTGDDYDPAVECVE